MNKSRNFFNLVLNSFCFERNKIIKDNSFPIILLKYLQKVKTIRIVNLLFKNSLKNATAMPNSVESNSNITSSRLWLIQLNCYITLAIFWQNYRLNIKLEVTQSFPSYLLCYFFVLLQKKKRRVNRWKNPISILLVLSLIHLLPLSLWWSPSPSLLPVPLKITFDLGIPLLVLINLGPLRFDSTSWDSQLRNKRILNGDGSLNNW